MAWGEPGQIAESRVSVAGVTHVTQALGCGNGHEDLRAPSYGDFLALGRACPHVRCAQTGAEPQAGSRPQARRA
jgi:hypothetical protein